MSEQSILRLARSDMIGGDSFVLVHVLKNGPQELDLRLLATEGESPYLGFVRQRQASKLRTASYNGSDEEWTAILSSALLQNPVDSKFAHALDGLEVSAAITEAERLSIVLRKNIGGITHRLGAIHLNIKQDEEIELFQWTALAAQDAFRSRKESFEFKQSLDARQAVIEKLHAQIEDLIKAKKEHEEVLLEKFQRLLNSKKNKIRDQQRLLGDVSAGPAITSKLNSPAAGKPKDTQSRKSSARKVGASRTSKRKAAAEVEYADEETITKNRDDKEDETTEDDTDEEYAAQVTTPDKNDDETTDDEQSKPPAALATKASEAVEDAPPPRRALPFAKREARDSKALPKRGTRQSTRTQKNDDETEEEDDEL